MFCKHCGKPVSDNINFCTSCGKPLSSDIPNTQNTQNKATMDLWLVLTIVSALLFILSLSMATVWGDVPLKKLDVEDTLSSALLSIGAIGVSGYNFFNEKKQKDSSNGQTHKFVISLIVFINCAVMGSLLCLMPFLGSMN